MGSGADVDILDLDDAVPPAKKLAARTQVVNALHHRRAWVRINDVTTEFWKNDVAALRDSPGLLGVMLARNRLGERCRQDRRRTSVTTPVIAFIESAVGLEAAGTIATHPRVGRLAPRKRRLPHGRRSGYRP